MASPNYRRDIKTYYLKDKEEEKPYTLTEFRYSISPEGLCEIQWYNPGKLNALTPV